jgi:predicted amidohydrolase YtcJ
MRIKLYKSSVALFLLLQLMLSSCGLKRHADQVYYNGKVYLVDNAFSVVQAFAVSKGKIKEVGSSQDLLDEFEDAEKIDLKGAVVFPGFIDAHCHFYGYASDLMKCDLYGTASYAEVISRVLEYSKTNNFHWILGRGWDQNDWEARRFPDKTELDSLYPDKPVFLMRIDGHAALCNQSALALAGIDPGSKIEGGEIVLKDGKLTGLVIDRAMERVKEKIPPFTPELIEQAILKAQENCFRAGLTTVDDAGIGRDSIETLIRLQKDEKLKMRIYAMASDDPATVKYYFEHGHYKSDRMNVRAIKTYADGSLGSRGACLKEEYSDQPGHYGFMLHTPKYFNKLASDALLYNFQLCTHAIGDSACKEIIDIYSNHLSTDNRRRWRIEHCQVMDVKERRKMGEYAIIPSVQPTHATSDMYWAGERLGHSRLPAAYAYESLRRECDGIIAFGTDFPVEDLNPILTYYAAVSREDLDGKPKGGFLPDEKIKRKDAIRAMTLYAAYANFEEEEKGSLEEDKFADFVILDRDIIEIKEKDIPGTRVLATYINGEKVYGE